MPCMFNSIITSLVNWIEAIPDLVWAAIVASFMTFLGVSLQQKGEFRRLERRLQHEQGERKHDRQMSLRRDTFIAAADALAKQSEYLAQFAQLDFDFNKEQGRLQGVIGAMNKIHLIASMETVKALRESQKIFLEAIFELTEQRIPLDQIKRQIQDNEEAVKIWSAHRDELLQSIKASGNAPGFNQQAYDQLKRSFEVAQGEIKRVQEEQPRLRSRLYSDLLSIGARVQELTMEFSCALARLNLQARSELEAPLDENEYLKSIKDSVAFVIARTKKFHDNLRSRIK